ncbi:MAG: dihydrofolate reductase family protein [Pseudomonadota bacterium]
MKCSVFIATSADGYIATPDGGVEWLDACGTADADMGDQADMGFFKFISSVDCMILGRKCMEKLARLNIPKEQWPYGTIRMIALSNSVSKAPDNLYGKVEMYRGDVVSLIAQLEKEGFKHAYIDGGSTITSFLNQQLITDMQITQAPVLLGEGIPLFGKLEQPIQLEKTDATVYPNGFITTYYQVCYQ